MTWQTALQSGLIDLLLKITKYNLTSNGDFQFVHK